MRCSLAVILLEVVSFCILFHGASYAQDEYDKRRGGPQGPTVQELTFLPPYCTTKWKWDRGLANPEEVLKWKGVVGDAFIHLHHYCNGLNFLNRVGWGVGDRNLLLGLALNEFKYVQNNIPLDHVLRPEVEYNVGLVLFRSENTLQAISQLQKTIRLKPDYERAFLLLSFCYLRLGNRAGASDALQTGLNRVPESRALRNALNEINITKKDSDGRRYR